MMEDKRREISEGNKLIAEFMGWHYNKYGQWSRIEDLSIICGEGYSENWMRSLIFHESWDWLMPVVEKIESIDHVTEEGNWGKYSVTIYSKSISVGYGRFRIGDLHEGQTKLEALWQAAVQFIQWYNTQNSNNGR